MGVQLCLEFRPDVVEEGGGLLADVFDRLAAADRIVGDDQQGIGDIGSRSRVAAPVEGLLGDARRTLAVEDEIEEGVLPCRRGGPWRG